MAIHDFCNRIYQTNPAMYNKITLLQTLFHHLPILRINWSENVCDKHICSVLRHKFNEIKWVLKRRLYDRKAVVWLNKTVGVFFICLLFFLNQVNIYKNHLINISKVRLKTWEFDLWYCHIFLINIWPIYTYKAEGIHKVNGNFLRIHCQGFLIISL